MVVISRAVLLGSLARDIVFRVIFKAVSTFAALPEDFGDKLLIGRGTGIYWREATTKV